MEYEETINWILTNFYHITQVEALYLDPQMRLSSCQFQPHVYGDFHQLGMREMKPFLSELLAGQEGAGPGESYTYYLQNHLICNVSPLGGARRRGLILTQPLRLGLSGREELRNKYRELPPEEREACVAAALRAPMIDQKRIIPIGRALDLLIRQSFEGGPFRHAIRGSAQPPSYPAPPLPRAPGPEQAMQPHRFGGYATYSKLKHAISTGDTEALMEEIHFVGGENPPMDQLASKDILRSIKNRLIAACAMGRVLAVEAQAPYGKTRDFVEQTIRQIEATEDIHEMYQLTRAAFITMTRYVARARMSGHSKYVRLAREYIERHFAREITLESLAEAVGISKFYLSSLIKKETGQGVTGLINRVRIEESKKLLADPAMSLRTLSARVGFQNANYFSKVFKQHTGMTPREFTSAALQSAGEETEIKERLHTLLERLYRVEKNFPGIFDFCRIVDPIENRAWMLRPAGELKESVCYQFWGRTRACERCVPRMALNENRPFLKLDQGEGPVFLVLAMPALLGETRYVIELFQRRENNFFDCVREDCAGGALPPEHSLTQAE